MFKIKMFLKLIFFEIKKLLKSPFVFAFVFFAPLVLSICYSVISTSNASGSNASIDKSIVFVCDDVDNLPETCEIINEIFGESAEICWREDIDVCINELEIGKINLILHVDKSNNDSINVIYDGSSVASTTYKDKLVLEGYKYSYETIKNNLASFGIYVEDVALAIKGLSGNMNVLKQMEPIAFAVILAFVLIIGISYTMARDNETGVIKQLCYTPMSINKYLLIRLTFFTALSLVQSIIMLLVFYLFGVSQLCAIGLCGMALLFSFAFASMSMLFSTSKNQISAMSLAVIFIILPMIILIVGLNQFNDVVKLFLYVSPLTPFTLAFKSILNYGVVDYINIIALCIHSIFYFLFATIILNKKSGKGIYKRKTIR